jgi:hypothetical protein
VHPLIPASSEGFVLPDSAFEKLGIAEVTDRLRLESHFYDYGDRGGGEASLCATISATR